MANQFLGLSMFIMLLSFFIMLNTLSNFEEVKSKPVMSSISLAFSSKKVEESRPTTLETLAEDEGLNNGDALDNIEALFKAQISGYKLKHDRIGSSMHVRMRTRILERAISAAQRTANDPASGGANSFFLPTLVSLMQSGDSGVIYRMDMVLNTQGNPVHIQNGSPEKALKMIKAASLLSKGLEDAGLPKKLISSGLVEGKSGYVDLYFRRYEPFNPYGKGKSFSDKEAL